MKKEKDVAVVIQSVVQFYNIKNGIDALNKNGISYDIYVPIYEDNEGFKEIYDETYNKITSMKYDVKRKACNIKYKILLEPYPIDDIININHDYRLNYLYSSSVGAKPDIVLRPEFYIYYDGVLLYNLEEKEYLSAFCKTFLIGNLKFKNFKKIKNNTNKKIILYLPTYGNSSDIDYTIDIIKLLRKKYTVYVKAHHGTDFLVSERQKLELLKKSCDKFYESSENMISLLQDVDLVLSDNSGAIFDAIYSETPVVIFSKDTNRNKISDKFNTKQYDLIKLGVIPFTNNIKSVEEIVKQGLSKKTKNLQLKYKKENFYCPNDLVIDFIGIIKKFLSDDINIKYKILHDRLRASFDNLKKENIKIIDNYNNLNNIYIKLKEENNILLKEQENLLAKIKSMDNKVNRLYMKIRSKIKVKGKK